MASPRTPWRLRLQLWFSSRLPRTDALELTHRNVYILPTRPGWMMGITLLAMLVGSINYQLNLGYLLTFLLAGSTVVGLHVCHGNLRGLTLHLQPTAPGFVGSPLTLTLVLQHQGRIARPALTCRLLRLDADAHPDASIDVPAQGSTPVHLRWQAARRGRVDLPAVQVETRYPLGLFRAWAIWRPATPAWLYPQPEHPSPALPAGEPEARHDGLTRIRGSGDHDGVRAYRRGDPLRTIVWKRAAQSMARGSGELVSRDTVPAARQADLWLDWDHTGLSPTEARVSRLTAWVLAADQRDLPYGLRLPGLEVPPDTGSTHRQRCLEALALC